MIYFLLVVFALLPSTIWLLYFLRKDVHPESNPMILKIFFYGMLVAILAVFVELGFFQFSAKLPFSPFLISILNIFIGVSLTEEVFKYLVVRKKVLSSPEFDEPLDAMLYMIIAGLGFAASENLLLFLSPKVFLLEIKETLTLASLRFILATFLHALTSGAFGYFLAFSFFKSKKRPIFFSAGLTLAVALHGFYNLSIMEAGGYLKYILPIIIILGLAIFISLSLRKLKKLKSICEI